MLIAAICSVGIVAIIAKRYFTSLDEDTILQLVLGSRTDRCFAQIMDKHMLVFRSTHSHLFMKMQHAFSRPDLRARTAKNLIRKAQNRGVTPEQISAAISGLSSRANYLLIVNAADKRGINLSKIAAESWQLARFRAMTELVINITTSLPPPRPRAGAWRL